MFNSYEVDNSQTLKINAVSGTLVKNYRDSFILRFHMKSKIGDKILDKNPRLAEDDSYYTKDKPVVVLQVMLCGEQELLAEVMWKEDFDKLFEQQAENQTNGDVIKAMFPNARVSEIFLAFNDDEVYYVPIEKFNGATNEMRVMKSWWNAPYKKGTEE